MSRRKWAPIGAVAAILAVSGGLAGCNINGIGKPGSMFGHAKGVADQPRQPPNPNRPTGTIDPRDQNANPAPPRTVPIQGQSPNPLGVPPQGALPDPYANPPR